MAGPYATNVFPGDGVQTIFPSLVFQGGYLNASHIKAQYRDDTTNEVFPITVVSVAGSLVTNMPIGAVG